MEFPAVHTENSVQSENAELTTIRETIVISMGNSLLVALLSMIISSFRTRAALQAEILALRHQLAVLQANAPRHLRLKRSDRVLWVLLSRFWSGWHPSLQIVQPATVIAWHRTALFRMSRRRASVLSEELSFPSEYPRHKRIKPTTSQLGACFTSPG
jgi:hypothetical protein